MGCRRNTGCGGVMNEERFNQLMIRRIVVGLLLARFSFDVLRTEWGGGETKDSRNTVLKTKADAADMILHDYAFNLAPNPTEGFKRVHGIYTSIVDGRNARLKSGVRPTLPLLLAARVLCEPFFDEDSNISSVFEDVPDIGATSNSKNPASAVNYIVDFVNTGIATP